MAESQSTYQCFSCNRSDSVVPLVNLRYAGSEGWICPHCLPTLIHQPQKLAGKMVGTEKLGLPTPAKH